MEEMELYHVHLKNNFDRKWKVNNEIIVDETFDSIMNKRQQNFSQSIIISDSDGQKQINYSTALFNFFYRINGLNIIKNDDLKELKKMLEIGFEMTYNANFFKREAALESCRKDHFNDKPSRLHSIYLCDKDGLEYWTDIISNKMQKEIEVFRVLATEKVFKTNEQLLPIETKNYGETYNLSFHYWNPKFKNVNNYSNEYLAQGKIKVLSKEK